MAEVYTARLWGADGFRKIVALKRMLPALADDERFVEMFLHEAQMSSCISSPYVVQTLDLGRADDDSLFIVMELVHGVSLAALLGEAVRRRELIDIEIAVQILSQAALGLHDAHQAKTPEGKPLDLVHRDVSPQNILVDSAGRTRVTDFGVATALDYHTRTASGEIKGKLSYYTPEQAGGRPLDRRTDVFALGVVAWELLTGARLFKEDNALHTLSRISSGDVPPLNQLRPDVPATLERCVMRALSVDPSGRQSSAKEMAQELRSSAPSRLDDDQVARCVRQYLGDRLDSLEERLRESMAQSTSVTRRRGSRSTRAYQSIWILAAFVVLTGVLVAWLLRPVPTEESSSAQVPAAASPSVPTLPSVSAPAEDPPVPAPPDGRHPESPAAAAMESVAAPANASRPATATTRAPRFDAGAERADDEFEAQLGRVALSTPERRGLRLPRLLGQTERPTLYWEHSVRRTIGPRLLPSS